LGLKLPLGMASKLYLQILTNQMIFNGVAPGINFFRAGIHTPHLNISPKVILMDKPRQI
jgi:hypothetical protein